MLQDALGHNNKLTGQCECFKYSTETAVSDTRPRSPLGPSRAPQTRTCPSPLSISLYLCPQGSQTVPLASRLFRMRALQPPGVPHAHLPTPARKGARGVLTAVAAGGSGHSRVHTPGPGPWLVGLRARSPLPAPTPVGNSGRESWEEIGQLSLVILASPQGSG